MSPLSPHLLPCKPSGSHDENRSFPSETSKKDEPFLLTPSVYALSHHSNSTLSLAAPASSSPSIRRPSPFPSPPSASFYTRNLPLLLVALSQFFGALMAVTTRLLELDDEGGMSAMQILLVRWGITMVMCCGYMWWTKVPGFPFGKREVRWLLIARGVAGFVSNFGLFYALQYLPVAEVTVISFLAPSVASYACYLFANEPFTRTERLATLLSLLGVLLIAQPFSSNPTPIDLLPSTNSTLPSLDSRTLDLTPRSPPPVTPTHHALAILGTLLNVLGAAGAITFIRFIGPRAHPLISVNYFAVLSTLISSTTLTLSTALPATSPFHSSFALPRNGRQWLLLAFLGVAGFVMQFMLTAGLSKERGSRASQMMYTNMVWALGCDRVVFGTVLGGWSWVGSGCILGGAVWIAVKKGAGEGKEAGVGEGVRMGGLREVSSGREEGVGLLPVGGTEDEGRDSDDGVDIEMHAR